MHQNLIVYDSRAPLEFFAKNGFYQVGNRAFNYKVTALQEASRTKSDVRWVFNERAFASIDWTKSNYLSPSEMYRLRAIQLREQYDYLMLGWSGGADSTTILDTFLNNNIKLDEVVVLWAVSLTQGKYKPSYSLHSTNLSSEWDLTVKPRIEELRVKYPNLKITFKDTQIDDNQTEYREDSALIIDKHSFFTLARVRDLDRILRERSSQYQNIGYITGVNPPEMFFVDDNVYVSFSDTSTMPTAKSDYTLEGWTRNIEFFYWSPSMPELVREQCHTLLRVLNTNKSFRKFFKRKNQLGQVVSWPDYDALRHARKPYIYPTYPLTTFQARKPDLSLNYNSWHNWFYSNPHSIQYVESLDSAINSHLGLIDPRFLVYDNTVRPQGVMKRSPVAGYKSFESKPYYIGKLIPLE